MFLIILLYADIQLPSVWFKKVDVVFIYVILRGYDWALFNFYFYCVQYIYVLTKSSLWPDKTEIICFFFTCILNASKCDTNKMVARASHCTFISENGNYFGLCLIVHDFSYNVLTPDIKFHDFFARIAAHFIDLLISSIGCDPEEIRGKCPPPPNIQEIDYWLWFFAQQIIWEWVYVPPLENKLLPMISSIPRCGGQIKEFSSSSGCSCCVPTPLPSEMSLLFTVQITLQNVILPNFQV